MSTCRICGCGVIGGLCLSLGVRHPAHADHQHLHSEINTGDQAVETVVRNSTDPRSYEGGPREIAGIKVVIRHQA